MGRGAKVVGEKAVNGRAVGGRAEGVGVAGLSVGLAAPEGAALSEVRISSPPGRA